MNAPHQQAPQQPGPEDEIDDLKTMRSVYWVLQIISLFVFGISAGVTLWEAWDVIYDGIFGHGDSLFSAAGIMGILHRWPIMVPSFIGLWLFRELRERTEYKLEALLAAEQYYR